MRMLALTVALLASSAWTREPVRIPPCTLRLMELAAAQTERPPAEVIALIKAAYVECGDGNGLMTDLAMLEVQRKNYKAAAVAVRDELLKPRPDERAVGILVDLLPRLAAADADALRALGNSPEAPIHVRSELAVRNLWVQKVLCPNARVTSFDLSWAKNGSEPLQVATVECPKGKTRAVYFLEDPPANGGTSDEGIPADGGASTTASCPVVAATLPPLLERYGISTAEELKKGVLSTARSRSDAWLLAWVDDWLENGLIFEKLLQSDPDDLEAILETARAKSMVQDLDGALAVLGRASLETVHLVDTRGSNVSKPSAIRTKQCELLIAQRRLPEARKRCEEAIAAGSTRGAHRGLAKLEMLKGSQQDAWAHISLASDIDAWSGALYGVVAKRQGKDAEAKPWLERAVNTPPGIPAAQMAMSGVWLTLPEWVEEFELEQREDLASRFARCGHIYLALGVPDRASRCFDAADKQMKGPAVAARALHLAETNPVLALNELAPKAEPRSHPDVAFAMAAILERLGRYTEALPWLARGFWRLPAHAGGRETLQAVCAALKDPNCLDTYRASKRVLKDGGR